MSDSASPLGRYDDSGPDESDLHDVRLLALPVRLFAAGRQHHDELMREFSLLAVGEQQHPSNLPPRLLDLVQLLGERYGRTVARADEQVDAALANGELTVDLTYRVPSHVVEAANRLEALMAEADEFCRREQLLTLPRSPAMVRFARWYLDEFRRQVDGEPPRPWDGPLTP